MINNQLKNKKKKDHWLEEKTHLKKKRVSNRFCWVARVMGQPSFCSSRSFALSKLVQLPGRPARQV